MNFLNKLLYLLQPGFHLNHSCQTALTFMIDRWLKAVDKGELIGGGISISRSCKSFWSSWSWIAPSKIAEIQIFLHFATVIFFLFERQQTDCFYFKYIFRFTTGEIGRTSRVSFASCIILFLLMTYLYITQIITLIFLLMIVLYRRMGKTSFV